MYPSKIPKPLVSVVIPAFNAVRHVEQAINSVLAQTYRNYEIIVVDDGSTDSTCSIVRSIPGVLLLQQANFGPAHARNSGIAHARGQYIAFLDSDDLWPQGKLRSQIALMETHPDAGMVFGDTTQFNNNGYSAKTVFEEGGYTDDIWGDPVYVKQASKKLLTANFVTTGSVVVRRECLKKSGLFDETLRYVEDLDLWLRVALHYPILHCDNVCLLRRRHRRNTSSDVLAMKLCYLRVLNKHAATILGRKKSKGVYADAYFNVGITYLQYFDRLHAMRYFAKSMMQRVSGRTLFYFISSVFPNKIIQNIVK